MAQYQKNYKAERDYYEKAFSYMNKGSIIKLCYDQYIDCLLYNKDTLSAINAEVDYLETGDVDIFSKKFIEKKFGEKYGAALFQKFPKIKQKHESSITENQKALRELEKRDQAIRLDKKNMPQQEFERLRVYTDSINFYDLFQLVKNKNANPVDCGILVHLYGNNRKYFNLYDSIYKSKVYIGEASPEAYVQWYDRQRMYVNKMTTQLYGEWNEQGDGSTEFNTIEDIQYVDKRRAVLGLCSLKDYALLHKMNLPKEYQSSKK